VHPSLKQSLSGLHNISQSEYAIQEITVVRAVLQNISSSNYANNLTNTAMDRADQDRYNETLAIAVTEKPNYKST